MSHLLTILSTLTVEASPHVSQGITVLGIPFDPTITMNAVIDAIAILASGLAIYTKLIQREERQNSRLDTVERMAKEHKKFAEATTETMTEIRIAIAKLIEITSENKQRINHIVETR